MLRGGAQIYSFAYGHSVVLEPLLKRPFFASLNGFDILIWNQEHRCTGWLLYSEFYSLITYFILMPVPRCFDYFWFCCKFWNEEVTVPQFYSFSRMFWLFMIPCQFHMKFIISFSVSGGKKRPLGFWLGAALSCGLLE